MSIKVYKKRGAANYHERKLIRQLEPAIDKLIEENPEFANTFRAAESIEELKELHSRYCIDDAEIISENPDTMADAKTEPKESTDGSIKFDNPETPLEDPMNRANPIIREHVLNDSFSSEGNKRPDIGGQPNLDEPKSYEEAFKLPDEDLEPAERKAKQKADAAKNSDAGGSKSKSEPVNPEFNEMSQQRKMKQTKRFSKYLVELYAMGMEHGYVWFVTKDITDAKLAEYELKDKIDPNHLQILMTLSDDQQMTIRQFFQLQCTTAQKNAVISKEDKEELTDALADVLMEKGFAPTPMQSLMVIAGEITISKLFPAFLQAQQNNAILKELFALRARDKAEEQEMMQHAARTNSAQTNPAAQTKPDAEAPGQQEPDSEPETQDEEPTVV